MLNVILKETSLSKTVINNFLWILIFWILIFLIGRFQVKNGNPIFFFVQTNSFKYPLLNTDKQRVYRRLRWKTQIHQFLII